MSERPDLTPEEVAYLERLKQTFTPDDWRLLREFNDFCQLAGEETETPPPGGLTTRELFFLVWLRRHSDEDKERIGHLLEILPKRHKGDADQKAGAE